MVRFFMSLRFRLILLVIVSLLPIVGVTIYNAMMARREATPVAQARLQRLVALVAREQAQKTLMAKQFLMSLSLQPAVGRLDAAACNALFSRLESQSSIFINVGAVDPEANVFASALPMSGPVNAADKHWFQVARSTREFAIGKLMPGRIALKPVTVYGYPVLDKSGEVQAVLFASISMDWLNKLAGEAQLSSGSFLTIIDNQGTIIAQYPDPEEWAGKSLPPGGLIDIIRKDGQGTAEVQGMDGVPYLFAFRPLVRDRHLGFVIAGNPSREVYAAANQGMRRNLAILGGVLLLALGCAWGFGRLFIMRRINPLLQTTARLAAGDLAARTGLTGGPEELSQLAQAFDQMAATLEEREAERQRSKSTLRDSERKYYDLYNLIRLIVDNVPDLIWGKGIDDKFILVNQAMCDSLLMIDSPEEALGKHDMFFAEKERLAGYQHTFGETCVNSDAMVKETKTPGRFIESGEIRGQKLVLDVYKALLLNEASEMIGTVGCARDVTREQEVEKSLRESEEKYRLLVSQIPAMVFQGYGDWSIDPLDEKVEALTGYSKEDFESRRVKWCDLIPAEDLDYATRVFTEALKTNKSYVREHRLRKKDGEMIWVQCHGQIFLND
jgi:PAS domain S-box-containing protein